MTTDKQKTFFSDDEELFPIIALTDDEAIALLKDLASTPRENTEARRAKWDQLKSAGYGFEVIGHKGWKLMKPIWQGEVEPHG